MVVPIPLLQTKLYIPRPRPGLVQRPRLIERLERGTASKVTLVSAPAGFGKTTLLADWLASGLTASADERSAAWLSLDRGDNDPASYWTYLITALQTAAPGVGADMLALLQEPNRRRSKRFLAGCSTTSAPLQRTSCWYSTTITSSRSGKCRTVWRSCSTICLPSFIW